MRHPVFHTSLPDATPRTLVYVGLVFLVAALMVSGPAVAQSTSAGAVPPDTTVAQVLADPEDDQKVMLRGSILEQLSTEKYMFSDNTGQIRVEIEKDDFPDMEFRPNMQIEISGEVETAFMRRPEIDVETLTVLHETP